MREHALDPVGMGCAALLGCIQLYVLRNVYIPPLKYLLQIELAKKQGKHC